MSGKIAVIGAGLAGATCARELQRAGRTVVVYEKSHAPGGRLATRRHDVASPPGGACASDYGAQYFTVRDPAFAERIDAARSGGHVAEWRPRWPDDTRERTAMHVAVPGMNALGRLFAAGLDLRCDTKVVALEREGAHWRLRDERGSASEPYAAVVLAIPAPQAVDLAGAQLDPRIAHVRMLPCWSVTLAFATPLPVPLDADWRPHDVLPWIARDTSKPGRDGLDAWVLHASAEWSAAHLDAAPGVVAAELTAAFAPRLGAVLGAAPSVPAPAASSAHRWRHARVDAPLGEDAWWDPARRLGACGDWCIDARVEAAFQSGLAMARRVVDTAPA